MGRFSCKGCQKRHVGCHATCETHIKEQEEHARLKAIEDKNKMVDRDFISHISTVNNKRRKRGTRGMYHYAGSED